ncbi:methyltransferase domain-containing protein [Nonomuraea sp. 3-1Str]|uniref:putative RNA methyltransferase n=1 Tax=Nonomuraea sp. 3-1Str TaxID=2929801 RepID=UPI00285AD364|nr:methyltransferase domain-containing protein [Nonomuraea sp. 3-1Str]MDR8407693.1 methyltransferase domain-containing protein [Nonomuraea sp. 3-1Str]
MLADIIEFLACPICREPVTIDRGAVRCGDGHAFDIAKQGYVSLLVGSRVPGTADSAEMVAARADFLSTGHFAPLVEAVAECVDMRITVGRESAGTAIREKSFAEPEDGATAKAYGGPGMDPGHRAEPVGQVPGDAPRPVIVDAGAGTGHYLASVLQAVDRSIGVAFDVSKHAVRRAARAHPRLGAFVADVWRPLPIRSGVADVVMDVFAPRNSAEFLRVLRPGGAVVVVTPAPAHLSPLVEELGLLSVDEDKERRLARGMEGFAEVDRRSITFDMELDRHGVAEVVRMGPSAWHTDPAELDERIAAYIARGTGTTAGATARAAGNPGKAVARAAFHLSVFEAAPKSRTIP